MFSICSVNKFEIYKSNIFFTSCKKLISNDKKWTFTISCEYNSRLTTGRGS